MVNVEKSRLLGFLAAAPFALGNSQVPTWREDVEVVAKSVVVTVDRTWLQAPELFNPGFWKVEVAEKPATVLAVQRLIDGNPRTTSGKPVEVASSVEAGSEPVADAADVGTTVLLLARICEPRNLRRSVAKLLAEPQELLWSGPVSVGIVQQGTRLLCSHVKKVDELRACLSALGREKTANEILQVRKWARDLEGSWSGVTSLAGFLEERAIRGALFGDVVSALRAVGSGAGLVILIWDGADGDPWEFWGTFAVERNAPGLKRKAPGVGREALDKKDEGKSKDSGSAADFAFDREAAQWSELKAWVEEMAVDGRVVVSLFPGFGASMYPSWAAAYSGSSKFRDFMDARREWRPSRGALEYLLVPDSHRVPQFMAEITGGTVINPKESLKSGLLRLEGKLVITFQIQGPVPCGDRAVTIHHSKFGEPLQRPKAVRFCSAWDREQKLVQMLGGDLSFYGDVAVYADVKQMANKGGGVLEALIRVEVDPTPMLAKHGDGAELQWRMTAATLRGPFGRKTGNLSISSPQTLPPKENSVLVRVPVPADAHRLLILVEEVQTGAWGAAVVDFGEKINANR